MTVYKIQLTEDEGMQAISLVEKPATELEFLAFSDKSLWKFDEEQRCITGVVCPADTPIYYPKYGVDSYIMFPKEVIKQMIIQYSKQGNFNSVNIEHKGDHIDGCFLYESYIYDKTNSLFDVNPGSWVCSFKVENDEVWKQIQEGKLKGFSLEGLFSIDKKEESLDDLLNQYLYGQN